MKKLFYPYDYVESVFQIDYEKLYKSGFKGLVFDIDNTLVFQDCDSTKQVDEFFKYLHSLGFKTFLLSNNNDERVKRFTKNINTQYISKAYKPFPRNFRKALKCMNLEKEEAVFIGDQIFTDVLGANLFGMPSIMVRFIRSDKKPMGGKRRAIESVILKRYEKDTLSQKRLGDIIINGE